MATNHLPRKTNREIMEFIISRVKPFFDRGDILISKGRRSVYDSVEQSLRSQGNVAVESAPGTDHLSAPDFTFLPTHPKYYADSVKVCTFYIDDTIDIPVKELKYIDLFGTLYHSLFNRRRYGMIQRSVPLYTTIDGEFQPFAEYQLMFIFPEKDLKMLEGYLNEYSENTILHLHVKGPANLSGGCDKNLAAQRIFTYQLCIHVESYLVKDIEVKP